MRFIFSLSGMQNLSLKPYNICRRCALRQPKYAFLYPDPHQLDIHFQKRGEKVKPCAMLLTSHLWAHFAGGGVLRYPVPKWLLFLYQCGEWFFTACVSSYSFFTTDSMQVNWQGTKFTAVSASITASITSVLVEKIKKRMSRPIVGSGDSCDLVGRFFSWGCFA